MADEATLCRHAYLDGVTLHVRYSLSDGSYVGEIDMTAAGKADVWQMLAYDLFQLTSAAALGASVPDPNSEPLVKAPV